MNGIGRNLSRARTWLTRGTVSAAGCLLLGASADDSGRRFQYPEARKADQVDNYHGTPVADPYRWLEDSDSPETRSWIEAQSRLTAEYFSSVPERRRIQARLNAVWNYEKYRPPVKENGRYFYTYNTGLQNQEALYVADSLKAKPRLLLDPNRLSADGTTAITSWSVSKDGRLVAYGLSFGGSDWTDWRIRDVESAKDREDVLKWAKFTEASWTHDNQGFFYSRFPAPQPGEELQAVTQDQKIYYHKLGTPQLEDLLIYERPDQPNWYLGAEVTEDGRYLVINAQLGTETKNRIFYKELRGDLQAGPVIELLGAGNAKYVFVGNDGPVFWFLTDHSAARKRLVAIDTRRPEPDRWLEIIPESADTLESVNVVGDQFLAAYLRDAHSLVKTFRLDGQADQDLPLPGLGSVSGVTGRRNDREGFYSFSGFTFPPAVYRYDVKTGSTALFKAPSVPLDFSRFETRLVFCTSKDGTRVPMFLTHRRDLELDGQNPTLLSGYGGFAISMPPSFYPADLVWLELGGVLASANLRGGGEYGETWHRAGRNRYKQNVFDDFIAAAEWLCANRYTSPPRLAINGVSNGGLLVGACLTQRPELFGAAIPEVGVLDMLRFHRFTVGWGWIPEYGNADDPEDFRILHSYSPLHRIRPGIAYPATLILTADRDDRVAPAHSFKFTAALQAAQAADGPILIRIEAKAGHGGGKPTGKQIDQYADMFTFLVRELKMKIPETLGRAPAS